MSGPENGGYLIPEALRLAPSLEGELPAPDPGRLAAIAEIPPEVIAESLGKRLP